MTTSPNTRATLLGAALLLTPLLLQLAPAQEPAATGSDAMGTANATPPPPPPPPPAPSPLPEGGEVILGTDSLLKLVFRGSESIQSKYELQEAPDGSKWVIITNPFSPQNVWGVSLQSVLPQSFRKGEVLLARIQARARQSSTGEAFASLLFEESQHPYGKALAGPVSVGPQWEEFFFPFVLDRDYAAGCAQVALSLGFPKQSIELAHLTLLRYPQSVDIKTLPATRFTYEGREPDAPWRAEAQARIRQHRMGEFRIQVRDANGQPVAHRKLEILQTAHHFPFGTAVDAPTILDRQSQDAAKYREILLQHFNTATIESHLKWPHLERDRRTGPDAARWLHQQGLRVRGHALVWPSWQYTPASLRKLAGQPDQLRQAILEHIRRTVTELQGICAYWDVVNEPFANNDILKILGDSAMVDWFREAHDADPQAQLFLNDYEFVTNAGKSHTHQDFTVRTAQSLRQQGAPIHGVGEQAHFGWRLTPPERVYELLDQLASTGLSVHITELDINISDRELQADYMRDFLTICYSHPQVDAIILWGFWEKSHWAPLAALWDKNWNLRPVGKAFLELLEEQWKTRTVIETDAEGRATLRGFFGQYLVRDAQNPAQASAPVALSKEAPSAEVTLSAP